jgi:hypothetical protein
MDTSNDSGTEEELLAEERANIALAICNSEQFMWLMVGANHTESHLRALRPAFKRFTELGGGYGKFHGERS